MSATDAQWFGLGLTQITIVLLLIWITIILHDIKAYLKQIAEKKEII